MSSIVRQRISSSFGEHTSTASACAREIATFRRLRENRKPSERTRSSPLDVAIEKNTTGASCPWNLSTVPTRTTAGSAALVTQELPRCYTYVLLLYHLSVTLWLCRRNIAASP